MIDINFNISHPYIIDLKSIWCKVWRTPFKNKFIELEIYNTQTLIGFGFHWGIRRDHSGVDILLSLAGYCIHFNFYDNRHWNYTANSWEL